MPVTLTMPWFYGAGALLLAIALVLFARWHARHRRGGASRATVVLWLIALGIVAVKLPSYLLDEIYLDDSQMRWSVGPWWDRAEGVILIPEARAIRVYKQRSSSGRLARLATYWEVALDDGTKESHLVFDLWMEHYGRIEEHFTSRGVPVK